MNLRSFACVGQRRRFDVHPDFLRKILEGFVEVLCELLRFQIVVLLLSGFDFRLERRNTGCKLGLRPGADVRQVASLATSLRLIRHRHRRHPVVNVVRPLKDGNQAVVVSLRNRVVLMRVALGTLQSEAQDSGTERFDFIRDHFKPLGNRVDDVRPGPVRSHPQKRGRYQSVGHFVVDGGGIFEIVEFVAGQLFKQKTIVRFVIVERPHDVISKPPGVRSDRIRAAFTFRVGITSQVQPVAAPAFSVVR